MSNFIKSMNSTMKNSTVLSLLLFSNFSFLFANAISDGPTEVENWFNNLNHAKHPEKTTKLHFYFHDLLGGKTVTSTVVAQANTTATSPTSFGAFIIADDPLTVGPEFFSKRVGYVKGFFGSDSLEDVDTIMVMTFVFTDEAFSGSTLSILGHIPESNKYRELPIVGGSGRFRLARGVATLHDYFYNATAGNATVAVDMIVLHY